MTDKIVNMFEAKQRMQSIYNLEQASSDVQKYTDVVNKSIEDFNTYSVMEKQSLYESLATFNIVLLDQLLERKRNEYN